MVADRTVTRVIGATCREPQAAFRSVPPFTATFLPPVPSGAG